MTDPERLLDALLDLPQLVQAQLSPHGRLLAWTWLGLEPTPQVWARTPEGAPQQVSNGPTKNFLVGFLPDGDGVLYAADPGDERAALYAARLGATPRLLSEPHPPYYRRGAALHPAHPWLFFGANYDFDRKAHIEPTWIWRQDLESSEHRALARPARPRASGPELSPDGRHLLYHRADLDPAGRQAWVVDVEGVHDRELVNVGADRKVFATWTAAGEVAFLAEEKSHRRLGVRPLEGLARTLIDDLTLNLEGLARLEATPLLAAVVVENARHHTLIVDPLSGRTRPVKPPFGNLRLLGRMGPGWVGVFSSAIHPADIVMLDPDDPDPAGFQSLTGLPEHLPLHPSELVPPEDFFWKSRDGLTIHGFLYRTRKRPKGTLVLIHGGPTARASEEVRPEVQYYLARGFNVFLPNYRGSTGYGLAFQEKIKETGWGGLEQADITTGIEALIEAGIAEPYRVGVTGTSYGGYSSWWQITHAPPALVAAAAPICGMTDLVVDYKTTRPDLRPYSEEMLGGSPEEVPERYRERSPIHYVDRIRGQLLIVQGALDPNVTPENVRAVEARLKSHGIPYELLVFEDEGHGIIKKENRRRLYRRLADFFEAAFAAF